MLLCLMPGFILDEVLISLDYSFVLNSSGNTANMTLTNNTCPCLLALSELASYSTNLAFDWPINIPFHQNTITYCLMLRKGQ